MLKSAQRVTNRGQALVIILLVLAVAATIVLSLISRTVTDIAITTKERDSSRAFSAAEAGIEEALGGVVASGPVQLGPGLTYQAQVGLLAEGSTEFNSPFLVSAGDVFPVWFVSHADDGSLTCSGKPCYDGSSLKVCWGSEGTPPDKSTTPAIGVSVIYKNDPAQADYSSIRIARAAYDPNLTRAILNKFSPPDGGSCSIGGKTYAFGKNINFSDLNIPSRVFTPGGLQTARIRILYNTDAPQPVGVSIPTSSFPSQGTAITSTGVADEATRKIQVFKLFADLPPIFDFAAFSSSGSLEK